MDINEIRQRIADLAKEKEILEESLQEAMVSAIQEIAKENPYGVKRVGKGIKMMTISSSQLCGNWSMEFYDWEASADAVLKYLEKTPVTNWKKRLEELLESKGEVIDLKRRGTYWPGMRGIVQRTPIERKFIEKIINKI